MTKHRDYRDHRLRRGRYRCQRHALLRLALASSTDSWSTRWSDACFVPAASAMISNTSPTDSVRFTPSSHNCLHVPGQRLCFSQLRQDRVPLDPRSRWLRWFRNSAAARRGPVRSEHGCRSPTAEAWPIVAGAPGDSSIVKARYVLAASPGANLVSEQARQFENRQALRGACAGRTRWQSVPDKTSGASLVTAQASSKAMVKSSLSRVL